MPGLKALIGDLFASDAQTLVNTVNCVGVMGKGVALEFKKRFPAMFEDYVRRCEGGEVRLGEPYIYTDLSGARIINFPTKAHWRSPARLTDIEEGLDYLAGHIAEWRVTSLAMPPLGCGNGGLEWSEVGPLIYHKLHGLPIDVYVFAPYGTPKHELSESFLAAPSQKTLAGTRQRQEKQNPNSVVLLEVLRELQRQPYANPVGRTTFQKICYVLTECGVPTGFRFEKGSYGPFSPDVKLALHEFANRNWLQEKQLGRMTALVVGRQYEADRRRFAASIEHYRRKIDMSVDLFSRIKNTEQAEEVVTVLFASRELKRARPHDEISEQQLFNYILNWKKSWSSDEKKRALASAIRNLVVLGWLRVKISESMIDAG